MFLRALGRFLEDRRFDALAQLLRHPDMGPYLTSKTSDEHTQAGIDDWLSLLDTYATQHLQGKLTGDWLGDKGRKERLKALWDAVADLLPVHPRERRALPKWSEPIAEALRLVYAPITLKEQDKQDQRLAASLELVTGLLREQQELNPSSTSCPTLTASQAITITLSRLGDAALPDETQGPSIEMLGFLELAQDDAPNLILTGVNEGHIPSSRNADAFLPDSVRAALSMRDNAHRYARDLFQLSCILQSRPNVALLTARASDEGDPLSPSRLLLACNDDTVIRRVRAFFDDNEHTPKARYPGCSAQARKTGSSSPAPLCRRPRLIGCGSLLFGITLHARTGSTSGTS